MSDEPRDETHLLWETLGSESLHDARIFSVRTVNRRSPRGTVAPFVVVDAPDWVTVIAEDTPLQASAAASRCASTATAPRE